MSDQDPRVTPRLSSTGARIGSFLGWAFVISLVLHAIGLPFVHLNQADTNKEQIEKVSFSKKIKVAVPTPPPPTPTPPPPTPQPKQTPPPVHQTNPPPVPKLKVHPPKTVSNSNNGPSESKYVAPKNGSENGVPQGNSNTGKPQAVVPAGKPAPPAPTAPPTPAATPKPKCPDPNAPAAIKGQAVEPDYPEMARQQGAVGTSEIEVTLTPSGALAGTPTVYKSSGNAALDQAAIKAAQETQYTPALRDCVAVSGSYLFQADFTGQ